MREESAPDTEIVHLIATILAARPTAADEVPEVITSLHKTLARLRSGEPEAAPAEAVSVVLAAPPRQPSAAPNPRRGRGRPKSAEPPIDERVRQPEAAAAVPATPRLMRRADVARVEPISFEAPPPQNPTLRGVVRWFDLRTRQGTLRLPGFAEDIAIDASALERAGISRLYKGQEVEATVTGESGSAHLLSLALPGRIAEPASGLFKSGSARRHAKPVVVEMKRDSMRRAAARVEAEHVLGSNGRSRV